MKNLYVKAGKSLVSIVKSTGDIKRDVREAVDKIGGLKKTVKKGDVVFVKPNYVDDYPYPCTTSPDFLKAAVELIFEAGAKKVIIGESSWSNTRNTLKHWKAFEVGEQTGAEVIVFEEKPWVEKKINGKTINKVHIPEILGKVDKIIYLANLKTHPEARFTGSLKLSIGIIKHEERGSHSNMEEKTAEVATLINPDLCIMDARKVFVTAGPNKGDVESPGLILASGDRIAMDVEGVKILQKYPAKNRLNMDVWDMPQIKRAVELKLGSKSEDDYKVL